MEEEFFRKSASVGCLVSLHADFTTRHPAVNFALKPKKQDLNESVKSSTNIHGLMSGRGTYFFVIGMLAFLFAVLFGGVV